MKHPIRSFALFISVSAAIVVLSIVGVGLWFFSSHHDSALVSAQVAEAEFLQLRARFSDKKPLLDMGCREPLAGPDASLVAAPLHSVHTVIFDTRGSQRIVRITVPYSFARYFAGRTGEFRWLGELTFLDDTEFDPEGIHLTLDQLEQHGPGLIAYYRHSSGGQFISWAE